MLTWGGQKASAKEVRYVMIVACILWLLGAAHAFGQDAASCTKLQSNKGTTICKAAAGEAVTYQKFETFEDSMSQETISAGEYTRLLNLELAFQLARTAAATANNARLENQLQAMKLTNKKACTAAGFDWSHGVCNFTEGK